MKDLTSFTLSVIRKLEEEGRFGTAHVYRSTLHAFQKFWQEGHPGRSAPTGRVFTAATLQEFERHLRERMLRSNTVSTYMRMLRALYNRALRVGITGYVPGLFSRVYTGTRADAKRALPPVQMGKVLAAPEQQDRNWRGHAYGSPCCSCSEECLLQTWQGCANATCRTGKSLTAGKRQEECCG